MAQVTTVKLVDDLDGGEADTTVEFGLGGKVYEIDLRQANAEKLWTLLAPFVEKARRKAVGNVRPAKPAGKPRTTREQSSDLREWARAHGFAVGDRGRIPSDALEAFENRHRNNGTQFQDPDPAPIEDRPEFDVSFKAAKEVEAAVNGSEMVATAIEVTPKQSKAIADIEAAVKATKADQAAARKAKAEELAAKAKAPVSSAAHNGAIRDWAAKNGMECSDRGRIPAAVVEAFDKAHTKAK